MHKWLLFLIVNGTVCAGTWAQLSPQAALEPANPLTREQRRVELRTALQAQSLHAGTMAGGDVLPVERHLSEQERAEIRQQLRQQRAKKPTIHP